MIIGIDLGTTNSLVAYFTEEGPKIIPNRLGKHLTPSVVSIDEEQQIYVGDSAVERNLLYPGSGASVFKRDMGSKKEFKLLNQKFTAEDLSSFVLRALKEDAEHFLGEEVTEAIISVPAYFNESRRRATKRAGELAGLKVERIISEPTATAIAYGLYQNQDQARFLVFDLGGGTFDVSILELFDSILEVRAVAGDNFLGGEDFTNIIENMFFSNFPKIDKSSLDEKTLRYIHKQAELCKLSFTEDKSATMECKINDEVYSYKITFSQYEQACEDLLERIRQPIKRSLNDAHIRLKDIDKVVLVGGATKSPVIRRFVSKLFKMFPDTSINPDEAVALGTALQGAMKERRNEIKEVIWKNFSNLSSSKVMTLRSKGTHHKIMRTLCTKNILESLLSKMFLCIKSMSALPTRPFDPNIILYIHISTSNTAYNLVMQPVSHTLFLRTSKT